MQSIPSFFMGKTPLSPPNPSEESLNLFFKRTHLNSTAKTISKGMELQWVQRWQLPLPTSFCWRSRQKYRTSAKLNLLSGKDRLTIFFSLWRTERKEIDEFIALANRHHPSIKFTPKISDKEINFLDTTV